MKQVMRDLLERECGYIDLAFARLLFKRVNERDPQMLMEEYPVRYLDIPSSDHLTQCGHNYNLCC